MRLNFRLIGFTFLLVAITVLCKYFFGSNLDMSGFSPILAIALLSGMILKQKDYSFLLPLLSLLVSDGVIEILHRQGLFDYAGFYKGQWLNYLLLLLTSVIGWMIKGNNGARLAAGGLIAPTVYFLLSNTLVWASVKEAPYTPDFSGWLTCMNAALPFYKNSLIATALFLPAIAMLYNALVVRRWKLTLA